MSKSSSVARNASAKGDEVDDIWNCTAFREWNFLADGEESHDRYSVSIWWVDPEKPGPGPHAHEGNEELFYVIEGTLTFLVGDQHVDASAGTFLRVPAGVTHDFENRTARRAGALNIFIPAGFESMMPAIVGWYRAQSDA